MLGNHIEKGGRGENEEAQKNLRQPESKQEIKSVEEQSGVVIERKPTEEEGVRARRILNQARRKAKEKSLAEAKINAVDEVKDPVDEEITEDINVVKKKKSFLDRLLGK